MEPVSPIHDMVVGISHLELAESPELYSEALVSYYSSNRFSQSASCEQDTTIHLQPHFISFLTVAQNLGIDLISFRWQPALDKIGEGRTAKISQAFLRLQTNFAFKRIKPATPSQLAERRAFQAIYTEVSILGLRRIRNHPNILRLEGICWDVWEEKDRGASEVWPVFVFEKTPYGDLDTFLRSAPGQNLNFEEKLQLCSGIASAVREMHAHHVIHGDIKPANILIFRDDSNRYIVKVADFGYSTMATNNGLVYLPKSVPWNAPEHHGRDFTFQEAIKCDTYSFGLVCLRILFEGQLLQHFPSFSEAYKREMFLLGEDRIVEVPETPGSETDFLSFAINIVESKERLESKQKKNLETFFKVAIARDANLRTDDFLELQRLLSNDQNVMTMLSYDRRKPASLSCHANFQITQSIFFLVEAHYLVRSYIVKCLEDFYKGSDCQICKQEVAFQLAFSYNVGFGAAHDEEICMRWLKNSGRKITDLNVAKKVAEQPYWRYRSETLQDFDQKGYLHTADIVAEYRNKGKITDAEKECRREIQDFEASFGQNVLIIKTLKVQLADILGAGGNFSEVEDILRTLNDEGETGLRPGDDDGTFLDIPNRLAIALHRQGKNGEAMEILKKDIEKKESLLEKGSISELHSKITLAEVFKDQGDYPASEKLIREALERLKELLDPNDPEVLIVTGNLAQILFKQGRYQEAEDLEVRTLEGRKKVLGYEHPDTLTSFNNLALVLTSQDKNEEAESKQRYALEIRQKVFGKMHPDTLASLDNLAALLGRQGQFEAAKAMHEDALEGRENLLGKEDPQTLGSANGLAVILDRLGRFEEAEKLYRQNLEISEKVLGKDNPDILSRMSNLAGVLQSQGQYEEAKEMHELALKRGKKILGDNHPLTLSIASNLALDLQRLGEVQASEVIYRGIFERSKDAMGLCHHLTLAIMGNLGELLRVQGKFEEATQMNQEVLEETEKTLGESHYATLTAAQNLAASLHSQKRHVEAVPLYMRACGGLRILLGPDHPQTIECFRNYYDMIQALSEEEIQASS